MRLSFPLLVIAALSVWDVGPADARQGKARPSDVQRHAAGRALRIPLRPMTALPMPRPVRKWKEGRGPKCIVRAHIAAASINGPDAIDFILRDRTLIRTRLQKNCPAFDYYSVLYLKPTADGKTCSDRDAVHARSGGECGIDAFRKLTPRR